MAADPFNSAGGYTVGIPPYTVIDQNGNITSPRAIIANVSIIGDTIISGNVQAGVYKGQFQGDVVGNVVVGGESTWVMVNDNGNLGAFEGFTFDSTQELVTIKGDLVANSITIGSGTNEFSTSRVIMATTNSSSPDQVLYRLTANTICSVDYTIIATDPTSNTRQTSKLFASVLGTEVGFYEYGTIDVPVQSPGVGDFKVTYSAPDVLLTVTPMTNNQTNYKIMVTSYKE
jgi:hypothetical protein